MLAEANDEEIRSVLAKKGNDTIDFLGLDEMAGDLNGVSAPLGDGRLNEFLVKSPPVRFDTSRYIRSNCDDESRVNGGWLNHGYRLQGRAKHLA
jgi:hypothetical protein